MQGDGEINALFSGIKGAQTPLGDLINTVRAETSARLNDTLETVYKLIPESTHIKGRGKHSLLPFMGQLSRSIFRTATFDDINVLARHINGLSQRTVKISN